MLEEIAVLGVPELSTPRAVIFDWDNTLVDSWLAIHEALNATLAEMGHQAWTLDETKERSRESLRNAFPKLFGDGWEKAADHFLEFFEAHHLDRLTPLEGAEALVKALHEAGVWLAIVSNKTGRLLRSEVSALGWDKYFRHVIGAGDASDDKPHPAVIDMALRDSGLQPGEAIWFVGDTDIDIQCAMASGCFPVLLHSSSETASLLGNQLLKGNTLPNYQNCISILDAYRQISRLQDGVAMNK